MRAGTQTDEDAAHELLALVQKDSISRSAFEGFGSPPIPTIEIVWFKRALDGSIQLEGPDDAKLVRLIGQLSEQDRSVGSGSLDDQNIFILLREARGTELGVLLIVSIADAELVLSEQSQLKLTKAELRLAIHTLAGFGLAASARLDGVSPATKKTQSRSLLSKTECADLGLLRTTALATLLSKISSDDSAAHSQADRETMDRLEKNFGQPFHYWALTRRDGTQARFVSFGRTEHHPILVHAPMLLPSFDQSEVDQIVESGLRLIVPLREGAFAANAEKLDASTYRRRYFEGLLLFHELWGQGPLLNLGLVSGCIYALEWARQSPHLVKELALVSAPIKPTQDESVAGKLRRSIFSLARNNLPMVRLIISRMFRRVKSDRELHSFLLKAYSDSVADVTVLQEEGSKDSSRGFLDWRFRSSAESVIQDFVAQDSFSIESALEGISVPMQLAHGDDDPIHKIENVEALVRRTEYFNELKVFSGVGQLAYRKNLGAVMGWLSGLRSSRERHERKSVSTPLS